MKRFANIFCLASSVFFTLLQAEADESIKAQKYAKAAAALLPVPWTDGEEMRLDLKFSNGAKIATAEYAVKSLETNGKKKWVFINRIFGASRSLSRVEAEANTLRPLHSMWKHSLIGEAEAQYTPEESVISLKNKDKPKRIELEGAVYDNEEAIQLLRCLPLAGGYKTTIQFLSSLSAGSIVPVQVTVTGPERINVSTGMFDCYKVALSVHQTFWYSADAHRYLVRYEAGGAVAELSQIAMPRPGQPEKYQEPDLGLSLAVPYDWRLFDKSGDAGTAAAMIDILDPEMATTTFLKAFKMESIAPEKRKTVRTWAEDEALGFSKTWKNFQVRPDSWKDQVIAGREGVTFVGDYADRQTNKVVLAAFTFGALSGAEFVMETTPQDLEAARSKFRTVLAGYQSK